MSDERQKNEVIDYLYGELDEDRVRALLRDAERDPELASDLRSLQATRALYQQAALPEPPPLLSEAILRQEKILRAQPTSFWAPLTRLFMHPAFGAAGIVVVAVGAGLVYTLSQPPAPAMLTSAPAAPTAAPASAPPAPGSAEPTAAVAARAAAKVEGPRGVEFAPEEAKAAGDGDEAAGGTRGGLRDSALAKRQQAEREKNFAPPPVTAVADDKDAVPVKARSALDYSAKKSAETWSKSNRARPEAAAEGQARTGGEQAVVAQPSKPVPLALEATDGVAEDAVETEFAQQKSPSLKAKGKATPSPISGSAGQLAMDEELMQSAAPAQTKQPAGAAGNVGTNDSILYPQGTSIGQSGGSAITSSGGSKSLAEQKPARLQPLPKSEAITVNPEVSAARVGRLARRAKDTFDAGLVAYDSRRYMEAYDLFKSAEQMDVGKKLAPGPQVMQARALYNYKLWRDSATILEQVLADYPKLEGRDQLFRLLEVCYQQLKDDTKLASARARRSREADRSTPIEEAPPAEEPAKKAAPANAQ